jgi:hypothetical protein
MQSQLLPVVAVLNRSRTLPVGRFLVLVVNVVSARRMGVFDHGSMQVSEVVGKGEWPQALIC